MMNSHFDKTIQTNFWNYLCCFGDSKATGHIKGYLTFKWNHVWIAPKKQNPTPVCNFQIV